MEGTERSPLCGCLAFSWRRGRARRGAPRRPRRLQLLVCALLLLGAAPAAAAEGAVLETYELGQHDPEAVMQVLKPLLKPETRLSHARGLLVVVGDSEDQAIVKQAVAKLETASEPAAAPKPQAPASPRQYRITILQGASPADVARLTAGGRGGAVQSTRSSRSGPQTTSLEVEAGKPASIETGRIVQAVDSVYGYAGGRRGYGDGFGVSLKDRPLTRGFTVTARPRGDRVELSIEASIAREGRDHAANAQVQQTSTTLVVPEGQWVVVGGGAPERSSAGKVYASGARLEESSLLVRVDRVLP